MVWLIIWVEPFKNNKIEMSLYGLVFKKKLRVYFE